RKVVLVSYFLSLVIFIDLVFGKVLTSFLHLPLGGQLFKISLVQQIPYLISGTKKNPLYPPLDSDGF
ncbi:MAG: hypothetical protein Q8755_02755, partial [Candidatus Phytoplasma australasiaticum]|nr:hypothetical protein [Candidatus Phytoplasma australasiaticum]